MKRNDLHHQHTASVSQGTSSIFTTRRLDFSDIPEAPDEELRRMHRVGRPKTGVAKQLIAIRLSLRFLTRLRKMAAKQGKPYQTLIYQFAGESGLTASVKKIMLQRKT